VRRVSCWGPPHLMPRRHQIGDNQSLLGSLKESAHFGPFKDQATQFETKLSTLDHCCLLMNQIQRKWVYLEPIFGRGALSEKERFRRIDDEFRDVMGKVRAHARARARLF
jgi:dynein heavy chain 2, cytosolic